MHVAAKKPKETAAPISLRSVTRAACGRDLPIGVALSLTVGLILMMAFFLAGAMLWQSYKSERKVVEARLVETSRFVASTFDTKVSARIGLLRGLAAMAYFDVVETMNLQSFHARLQAVALPQGDCVVLWKIDPEPHIAAHSMIPWGAPPQFLQRHDLASLRALLQWTVETQEPLIGDMFVSPIDGTQLFPIFVPVIREGTVVAVLGSFINAASLQAIMRRASAEEKHAGMITKVLTDGDFAVVAHDSPVFVGQKATPEFIEAVNSMASRGVHVGVGLAGRMMLFAYERPTMAPRWIVSAGAPIDELKATWIQMRRTLVSSALLCFMIAAYVTYSLSKALTQNALGLAQQMAAGITPEDGPLPVFTEFRALGRGMRTLASDMRGMNERLSLAAGAVGFGQWDTMSEGSVIWSDHHFKLFGLPKLGGNMIHQDTWLELVLPEDRPAIKTAVDAAKAGDGAFSVEYRIRRATDGEERWMLSTGRFLINDRSLGVTMDITERKNDEARRLLLMHEVDHRAKNVLQVAYGAVYLTRATTVNGYKKAITSRILALARAHSLLAKNGWSGSNIRTIANEEFEPHKGRLTVTGPDFVLRPDSVQPIAMIFHELVTNATKHGALSAQGGRISLTWTIENGTITIRWQETGGPPVVKPSGRGFGTKMIQSVMSQIDGKLDTEWNPNGLIVTIHASAERNIVGQ